MKIQIRHYEFEIEDRFVEGHVCSLGEAQVLNSKRAENIRNNLTPMVNKALAATPDGELLTPEALAEVKAKIEAYDKTYALLPRHEAKPKIKGTLQSEIRKVALDWALAQSRQAGVTLEGIALEQAISAMSEMPEVQALARAQISVREAVAHETLEDL